jgi:hypothetical protein
MAGRLRTVGKNPRYIVETSVVVDDDATTVVEVFVGGVKVVSGNVSGKVNSAAVLVVEVTRGEISPDAAVTGVSVGMKDWAGFNSKVAILSICASRRKSGQGAREKTRKRKRAKERTVANTACGCFKFPGHV